MGVGLDKHTYRQINNGGKGLNEGVLEYLCAPQSDLNDGISTPVCLFAC